MKFHTCAHKRPPFPQIPVLWVLPSHTYACLRPRMINGRLWLDAISTRADRLIPYMVMEEARSLSCFLETGDEAANERAPYRDSARGRHAPLFSSSSASTFSGVCSFTARNRAADKPAFSALSCTYAAVNHAFGCRVIHGFGSVVEQSLGNLWMSHVVYHTHTHTSWYLCDCSVSVHDPLLHSSSEIDAKSMPRSVFKSEM